MTPDKELKAKLLTRKTIIKNEAKTKRNMKRKPSIVIIAIIIFSFGEVNLYAQVIENAGKTIYIMRARQVYGSGAKMNLMINDKLAYKVKNGERLILKPDSNDTLNIQIVYPPVKSHKSEILQIPPDDENEIYIDLYYRGEGYNPIKHAEVLNRHGDSPDFNIEIIRMIRKEGEEKFNESKYFKEKKKKNVLKATEASATNK